MNRRAFIFAVSMLAFTVGADDLMLLDGRVLQEVAVVAANEERLLIAYAGGGLQVRRDEVDWTQLTEALKEDIRLEEQATARRRAERAVRAAEQEALRREEAAFAAEQRARGLVFYEGEWMSVEAKDQLLLKREEARLVLEKEQRELERQRLAAAESAANARAEQARKEAYTEAFWASAQRSRPVYYYGGPVYSRSRYPSSACRKTVFDSRRHLASGLTVYYSDGSGLRLEYGRIGALEP